MSRQKRSEFRKPEHHGIDRLLISGLCTHDANCFCWCALCMYTLCKLCTHLPQKRNYWLASDSQDCVHIVRKAQINSDYYFRIERIARSSLFLLVDRRLTAIQCQRKTPLVHGCACFGSQPRSRARRCWRRRVTGRLSSRQGCSSSRAAGCKRGSRREIRTSWR